MKKFVKLSGKKFVKTHWLSELADNYGTAWRFTEYMIREIRKRNPSNADELIKELINECWERFPLF